ncbi:hypothetical protein LWI28_005181 [Acer negundo]|uniref:Uncharacterized protein n=1 Tax=Acer negundo TaxID=4023 RepID=A0AAD5P119_ACENE|nr:hypothetical protein LWI28_005181 [Acer negundo]
MVGPRTEDGEQPQYGKFSVDLDDERCFMCVLCVVEDLVESDYEREEEEIAADTCVDPIRGWDSLHFVDIPRPKNGVGFDNDEGSEDLNSLDGSDSDTEEGYARPISQFKKKMYHEFNPSRDMQDPKFVLGVAHQLRVDTSVDMSIWQYHRARKRAKKMIQGFVEKQYSKVRDYGAEIIRTNLGSTFSLKCYTREGKENPRFQRLYICLDALKKG